MSLRKINFAPGEYFHIYNRGSDKRKLFNDNRDYNHFLKVLFLANSEKSFVLRDLRQDIYSIDRGKNLVNIGAYCAMPNHFHLLITPLEENGLSRFMLKFATSLSMYHNTKYSRTGSLFEGKFKAQHANTDEYLKYLFSYIHLNPLKLVEPDWKEVGIKDFDKASDFLKKYYFSSYLDYLGEARDEDKIINRTGFPNYFPSKKDFEEEIIGWISLNATTTEELPLWL